MASSGNGTFIPMVSSSPPPMDDGAFDDDDDEFSTFSSNPYGPGLDSPPGKWAPTATGKKGNGSFLPIKDDPPDPFLAKAKQNTSSDDGFGSFAAFSDSGTNSQNHADHLKRNTNNNIGRTSLNGNDDDDDDDDFADFASFETTTNSKPRAVSCKDSQPPSTTKSDSSLTCSIELNKNNSHENSDALTSKRFDETHKHGMEIPTLSFDKSPSIDSTSSLQGFSRPNISSGSCKLTSGENIAEMSTKSGSDDADLHQEDSLKLSMQSVVESQHSDGDTVVEDFSALELQGDGSGSSASHLGMPSAGSLNLFQDSDRQTFDSGIDSIMTPDSSPEGKDDVSPKADGPDNAVGGSGEPRPSVENDEWGDFDTFPSPQPLSRDSERLPSSSERTEVAADSVIGVSAKGEDSEFGDFGTFETFESVQQAPKEVENSSNSNGFTKEPDENSRNHDVSTAESKFSKVGDSDDDFGDFGSCREVVHRKNPSSCPLSSSDDFGGFESTASTRNDGKTKAQSDESAGDDWGSFGSGTVPSQSDNDDFSDFGSFNSSSATSSLPADSQKDDFGSFGSFPATSSSSTALSESAIGQEHHRTSDAVPAKVPSGGRVERVFYSCFSESMVVRGGGGGGLLGSSCASIRVLQEVVSSSSTQGSSKSHEPDASAERPPAKSSTSKSASQKAEVWSSLSDMENTVAQKYQWNNSKNSRKLLLSLGIDSRNILSSGRVGRPLFAQELGMLTPLKPGESAERSSSQGGATGELSSGSEDATPSSLSAPEDLVPKVEFDWSGSGLINPLDANSLNLDFFATERKSSSSRTKSKPVQKVDPELLDLAVSSPPDLAPASSSSSSAPSASTSAAPRSTTTALDEILKHSSSSMVKQKAKREAGLSAEANVVLDSLPDLSYMLAKVLMFPVASPTSAEEGVASSAWTEQTS